ncbi:hypothetical protein CSUI_008602 [Cystoisospora suis]|uniref:Uncharacterized protein n=1 Tax=Cystoisospora suis TaxID=483139 RepID=A0A2C6KJ47_9APIC|nr:hypothetical protein CSUI_008602 [Cystoisospora suis]
MEPMAAPGVSMFRSGTHCSWPCPLTCAIKYLPTCTNDCLESRRWCLKYASQEPRQAGEKKPGHARCLIQRTPAVPRVTRGRTEATSRILLGKHIPVVSSAGPFVFQRGLTHVVEPQTARGEDSDLEPDRHSETRHTGEAGTPAGTLQSNELDKLASWELPAKDEGTDDSLGRFRGATRQKQKTCNSEDTANCQSTQVHNNVYVTAAEPAEWIEADTVKAPRLTALRRQGLDCPASSDCELPHQATEDTLE